MKCNVRIPYARSKIRISSFTNNLTSMKLRYALLALLLAPLYALAQQLPTFSTDDSETWYYVTFTLNGSAFEDNGESQPIYNRTAAGDSDAQLWKLTGNQDSFVMTSKTGRNLYYNKSLNKCLASSTQATTLCLETNSNNDWEIQIKNHDEARSDVYYVVVMNEGSGVNRYLDLWEHDFAAAGIAFVDPNDMHFPQQPPSTPAEVGITGKNSAPAQPLSLWYTAPATDYTLHALPLGNGYMGAMFFGGIAQDRIQFNHKTLWRGSAGKDDLGSYLTFGDLYITNNNAQSATDYQRWLDINEGIGHVSYTSDGASYEREYLASNPDGVVAIRYRALDGGSLNMTLQLINGQGGDRAKNTAEGSMFSDKLANNMNYCAGYSLTHKGGTVTANSSQVEIKDAEEFTIYLACGTDFDPAQPNHLGGDADAVKTNVQTAIDNAKGKGYDAIRTDHVADYQSLFSRVAFTLPQAANLLPTPELLTSETEASKAMVDVLVFQYGRYLAISSSRGVSLPNNLQGIWCKDGNASGDAAWASDIHANINVQMNYWPVESTNLSELHMPFLEYIKNEATREGGTWQQNARDLQVEHGWVVNTAGNIFGGSSSYKSGKYSVANAWFCQHLWQHFSYTRDTAYLENFAMPLLRSTCEFWFERLVPAQNGDGSLECPNEYSPEQGRVQNATAHSQQLVYELFANTTKAIEILGDKSGCDEEFRTTLAEKMGKIDRGLRADEYGVLREWKYQSNAWDIPASSNNYFANDEEHVWQCHRHPSHLMALYPGFEIDKGIDPDIYNAAVASLTDRGDKSTGWGRAFRLCLWARTGNAAKAYSTLRGFAHRTTSLVYDWEGGLYDNLLNSHATNAFQLEGNFGATAGIAEMLLQSRPDSMVILPALPAEWSNGNISGLKAIGNFEVSLDWEEGKLVALHLTSLAGIPAKLAYPGFEKAVVTTEAGEKVETDGSVANLASFATTEGTTYLVKPYDPSTGITQAGNAPEDFEIHVSDGCISLPGYTGKAFVYDIQGQAMPLNSKLAPGIYLVKAGTVTRKVLVP